MSAIWLPLLFVALALILPVRSLMKRRLSFSNILVMGAVWAVIFGVAVLLVGLLIK